MRPQISVLFLLIACGWAFGQDSAGVVQRIARTEKVPVIDANLSDTCWRRSAVIGGFISNDGFWCREQTEGFLTYDERYLYIAVRCHDSQMDSLVAEDRVHDDVQMHKDDCVEIYFDINGDHNSFYHFIVNPQGNIYEALCDIQEGTRDVSWNPNCTIAAATGQNDWTVELGIPLAAFGITSLKPGMSFGFNLNRERSRSREYGSWAGTNSFNDPAQFGKLIFGSSDPISSSLLFTQDSLGHGAVRGIVRNHTTKTIRLQMQALLPELSGTSNQRYQDIILAPLGQEQIDLPWTIEGYNLKGAPKLTVKIAEVASKRIYQQKTGLLAIAPPVVTLTLNRYYYPADCNSILARVTTKLGVSLRVSIKRSAAGDVLMEKSCPILPGRNDYEVSLPADKLGVGRYVIIASVLDSNGREKHSAHRVVYRTALPEPRAIPYPVEKISFRDNGVILVNGVPFCPFFTSPPEIPAPPMANNAFNVNWGNFGLLPRALGRASLKPYQWIAKNGKTYALIGEDIEVQATVQTRMADYLTEHDQQIFDWYLGYEAQIPMCRDSTLCTPVNNVREFKKINDFVKSIDHKYPTNIQIDDLSRLGLYKDCADMIEVASYSSSYAKYLIPNLASDLVTIREVLGPSKPVLFYIGSSIPDENRRTPEEIRCAAYLILMHGMNGIVFHVGHDGINAESTRHWSLYKGLAREIEFVYQILISAQSAETPTVTAKGRNIDFRVKRYEGKIYLIVCNKGPVATTATFRFAGNGSYAHINLPFEHRQINFTNNAFTDECMPYETHIYEMIDKGQERN